MKQESPELNDVGMAADAHVMMAGPQPYDAHDSGAGQNEAVVVGGLHATMFATTLRSRRARQKSALPPLRWLPRFSLGQGRQEADRLIGAQVDMGQFWLTVPRRTARRSRRKSLEQQRRDFDFDLLQAACAQAAGWGDDMRLMVSLEDDLAPDSAFNSRLNTVLDQTGFPIARLDLVFQENGLAQEETDVGYTLASLRDRGARVFMNGFGTATSSLTFLRTLAIGGLLDGVQFDASVLSASSLSWEMDGAGQGLDAGAAAFYRAALDAVKAVGLQIRTVGVDDQAQMDFVRSFGCSEVSGTMFAPAETAQQIMERFSYRPDRTKRRRMCRTAEGL